MSRRSGFAKISNTTPSPIEASASCVYSPGHSPSASARNRPANRPARTKPSAKQRNQNPIIWPTNRGGASLVVVLSPTGLNESSPIVCNRYVSASQVGSTCWPDATSAAAPIITAVPTPSSTRPNANFAGAEGSRLRRASAIQNAEKNGASTRMKNGFRFWNQPAGTSKPKNTRSVFLSAKRLNDEPACSNPAQNSTEHRHS